MSHILYMLQIPNTPVSANVEYVELGIGNIILQYIGNINILDIAISPPKNNISR